MKFVKNILTIVVVFSFILTSSYANDALIKEGDKIFNSKKIGNCFACHDIDGKEINMPGSLGPKLTGLINYPEELLYDIVYDPYKALVKPTSSMPAFGKNGYLSDHQIKAVVAYLKTIK